MKPNYHWWPISFGWDSDPMAQTLCQWAKRAIESRKWAMDYPYRFRCLSTLEVHKAACLRMWHGWPIGNSWTEYGRTLHLGRFKVYFGSRSTPKSSTCRWCAEGRPEWSSDAKAWIHRRDRLDRRCENPPAATPQSVIVPLLGPVGERVHPLAAVRPVGHRASGGGTRNSTGSH